MKQNFRRKRLALNKQTVANLNNLELSNVRGGDTGPKVSIDILNGNNASGDDLICTRDISYKNAFCPTKKQPPPA